MQSFNINRREADEFLEVYKGVVSSTEFNSMSMELSSGPLIAIEVRSENCVRELRELAGPADFEVAKQLRPNTLRARFGNSTVQNAVHITDLPDCGALESMYFFDILVNNS